MARRSTVAYQKYQRQERQQSLRGVLERFDHVPNAAERLGRSRGPIQSLAPRGVKMTRDLRELIIKRKTIDGALLSESAWFELASAVLLELLGERVCADQMLGPALGEIFERLQDEALGPALGE
jgi:hypothetical protein